MKELGQRFWTSLLSFLVLLAILWVGLAALLPLLIVICLIALREYVDMLHLRDIEVRKGSLMVFGVLLIVASALGTQGNLGGWEVPWPGGSWREVVIGVYVVYVLVVELTNPGERPLERIVYSLFGMLYIPWLLGYFLLLRQTPSEAYGFGYLLLPLMASFATDTGGFFLGRFFGKRKLAPEVSPAKTIEGAIGGLFSSFLFVFGVSYILERNGLIHHTQILDIFLFSILVSCAAQLGDLAESLIKRSLGAKDSGAFLPGHGGLLDRLDSLLFAVPITYIYLSLVAFR